MELISFYFEKDFNRIRLLLSFFYLVCVVLITKNVLACLGYQYTFPKVITLSTAINFVMSGEIVLPVLFFTLYLYLTVIGSVYLYAIYYALARKTFMRGSTDTGNSIKIRKEMVSKRFAIEEPERFTRGPNYKSLAGFMNVMFYDTFNVGSLFRMNATLFFNITLLLVLFTPKSTLIWVCAIVSLLIFLVMSLLTLGYIRMAEYRPFYEMFVNHLEDPEKYPQKTIGYSTRKIEV